jgi:hypothetical protein
MYDWGPFREPVNRLINEETLNTLGNLPICSERLDPNIISCSFDEASINKTIKESG